ncbi:Cyb2p [Sugiyamaella lignohabitans]|uniref:L-lactate dehydrogenase (cytochrome) n=1 Tax=Sugiyamaella lignohabitans TaxID=796027 RepID=A0A167EZ51_9ASCO|nr:Cyb2p [Sugiyamaella lignohabitans]ANB14631.1 Cyb2p [Sugiyamaella lignohabitans]
MVKVLAEEIKKHTTKESCWVVLHGKVYDVTDFLSRHPGGQKAILRVAGKDATEEFDIIHPEGTLKSLSSSAYIGEVEDIENLKDTPETSNESKLGTVALPALDAMLNLDDFEKTAQKVISAKGWAYYYSASDDLVTKVYNNEVYRKVLLRPRIFKDVETVSTVSKIQGLVTTLPLFVSPAAMARLAHPSGEKGIAHACGSEGIVQMISNNASMKFEDIVSDPIVSTQKFFYQLYVQNDRKISENVLSKVIATGRCHAIVLTLDAPTPGKREADERVANDGKTFSENSGGIAKTETSEGLGRALFAGTSARLLWDDLHWLRKQIPADMPIILKGLQTYEDALIAATQWAPKGLVHGILLSNHGGRAMDQSQPPLMILQEIRKYAPEVFSSIEVYVDGGIRRGTDVVKALCLGAKQVGIGRAALYGLAGYGEQGVQRTIQILREEIETCMRLLGVNSVEELGPQHVNTRQLDNLVYSRL